MLRPLLKTSQLLQSHFNIEPLIDQLEPRLLLSGTTYVVDSLVDIIADDGVVTLREAIEAANTNTAVTNDVIPGSATETDTITFAQSILGKTITLAGSQLTITESLDIQGNPLYPITIDANSLSRVMLISNDNTHATINAITMTAGLTTTEGGGAIHNSGHLTLTNSVITDNYAQDSILAYGGGIYNAGYLELENTTISNNSVDSYNNNSYRIRSYGGGIYNAYGAYVLLTNSIVSENKSLSISPRYIGESYGGGIFNDIGGNIRIINSTISGNSASSQSRVVGYEYGGGICNIEGELSITASTISGNYSGNTNDNANPQGGGIYSYKGDNSLNDMTLTSNVSFWGGGVFLDESAASFINCSISDNTADYRGGGIYNDGSNISLTNSTVSGNSAAVDGGGIFNHSTEFSIDNTYFTDNFAARDGGGIFNAGNAFLSNSQISNNSAINSGGGIYNTTNLTLDNSSVSDNSALYGGGIYNNRYGQTTLKNSSIINNVASEDGGGIHIQKSNLTLINSTLSGNSAANNGGAIRSYSSWVTITNSTIVGNYASVRGGAIDIFSPSQFFRITNSTISGNESADNCGGIYNYSASYNQNLILNNTIVAMNIAPISPDINDIFINNNSLITKDPLFLRNPSPGPDGLWGTNDDDYGDLRLSPNSLAVNAGDNTLLPVDEFDIDGDFNTSETLPIDFAGNIRSHKTTVDIGAYENQSTHYIVDSLLDVVEEDGLVTLREAIEAANSNAAVTSDVTAGNDSEIDLITFNPTLASPGPATITLCGAELEISENIFIQGLGANLLTVDGNQQSRVFKIHPYSDNVQLTGLTISGGRTSMHGAGIFNDNSFLKLNDIVISRNHADTHGGGIYNTFGTITLINSMFLGNSTNGEGAGIYHASGTVTIINSVMSGNHAGGFGGAIRNHGYLTLNSSTLAGNSSIYGGGIYSNFEIDVSLVNSIISLNTAPIAKDIRGFFYSNYSLIRIDPLFVRNPSPGTDEQWGTNDDDYGDLQLLPSSPAVNNGLNDQLPNDDFDLDGDGIRQESLPIDITGYFRIEAENTDLGAYEMHLPGDLNRDGFANAIDIDLLRSNLNTPTIDPVFDLNEDNNVDTLDVDFLIHDIFNTEYGDANLDGRVGLLDLDILGQNYGATGTGWAQADFNGNGSITMLDLDILGDNWGARTMTLQTPTTIPSYSQLLPETLSTSTPSPAFHTLTSLLPDDEEPTPIQLF